MSETFPQGLLFVLGKVGNNATTDEFNDWYDNEHAPLRLTVPGFHNALRYKAADDREPAWLAIYDIDNPEVMVSDGYKALASKASERERALVSRLEMLNRRVYSLIAKHGDTTLQDSKLPSKYVVFASVAVSPEDAEELQKWYAEEHIDLISKVPGWIQSRRYKLVNGVELAGQAGGERDDPAPGNFLNVHYFDRPFDTSSPEAKAIYSSARAKEVSSKATARVLRQFVLYKDLGKPTWK